MLAVHSKYEITCNLKDICFWFFGCLYFVLEISIPLSKSICSAFCHYIENIFNWYSEVVGYIVINPFVLNAAFLYAPQKHQKTVDFFWGWRKGELGTNELISVSICCFSNIERLVNFLRSRSLRDLSWNNIYQVCFIVSKKIFKVLKRFMCNSRCWQNFWWCKTTQSVLPSLYTLFFIISEIHGLRISHSRKVVS